MDTDIGLRNLDVVLGLENRIVYNLVDVINGSCRLKQALIHDRRHPELFLLPSAQTKDKSAVSPEQMIKLTEELREEFDYVLLDCPAGIEQGFKNAVAGADKALVVTTPEVSAIRDADRIIGLLEAGGLRDIHLIINRLRPDMIARGDMMSVDDVIEILAVDLIGTIPDDEQIVVAANQGEPLSGKSLRQKRSTKTSADVFWARRFHLWKSAGKKACSSRLGQISENNFMIAEKGGYSVENRFTGKRPLRRLCQRQNENASGVRNGSTALHR